MPNYIYVPIVKGKANDLKAIADLSDAARATIKPLIELTEVAPDETVDEALREFADRIMRIIPSNQIFVDLYALTPDATTSAGTNATIAGFSMLGRAGCLYTPVYGFELNDSLWPHLSIVARQLTEGFCFRIDSDDLDDRADETWTQVIERTADLRLRPRDIDILIDLRQVGMRDINDLQELMLDFLLLRPTSFVARSYIVAGSSALRDVSGVPVNGTAAICRNELRLWARLQAELAGTTDLIFGDYGVINPDFTQAGPNPNMNGKIRYTTADRIHYFRGSRLRGSPGFSQFHELARRVEASPFYSGADFCIGDQYIADCAANRAGTGNLGTWVRVDQNHHFEYTARQLARLAAEVAKARSASEAELLVAES